MDLMDIRRGLMASISSNGFKAPAGCQIGVFTTDTDSLSYTVQHTLGTTPKFAIVLAVPNSSWTNIPSAAILFEYLMTDPQTGEFDISLPTSRNKRVVVLSTDGSTVNQTETYTVTPADVTDTSVTFVTGRYYGAKFVAGMTYLYILTT